MKSIALSFKTLRPVHLIPLFLLGLLIIAAAVCVSRGNCSAAQVADDASQKTKTVTAKKEIPKPANLVFKNANVITMKDEKILKNNSVFVSNGVITAIGDFNALSFPEDSIIIDATGRYLTPGFSDMHAHISNPEQDSKLFLANGVTIIRNMWGFPKHLALRERISMREVTGPELFTAGPVIDGKESFIGGSFKLTDVSKAEVAIRKMKEDGYDFIKVYNYLTLDVYDEIIRVARKINIPVVGHIPDAVGVSHVIESGQQSIEHFYGYTEPGSKGYDAQIEQTLKSGIWNCPTLIVLKSYEDIKGAKARGAEYLKYVDADTLNGWSMRYDLPSGFSWKKTLLIKLYDDGGNIVSGSDEGNPYVIPGFSLLDEFELMNEAGLTPYQVLRTTTIDPARMLGIEDRVGTIEPGKDADLVLLECNPLDNISNTRTIAGVMTKGTWLPKEVLQKMLDEVEESFGKKNTGPTIESEQNNKKGSSAVDGTWTATADGPDGNPLEATYVFEAQGNTLLGTVNTRFGGGPFSEGKIDGDKISFVVRYGETTIEWSGTVSGDVINFTKRKGDNVVQFTAKRVGK